MTIFDGKTANRKRNRISIFDIFDIFDKTENHRIYIRQTPPFRASVTNMEAGKREKITGETPEENPAVQWFDEAAKTIARRWDARPAREAVDLSEPFAALKYRRRKLAAMLAEVEGRS